jgi:hypothetical protein
MERGVLLRAAPGAKGDELRPFPARRRAVTLPEDFGGFGDMASEIRLEAEAVVLAYMGDQLDDGHLALIEGRFEHHALGDCFGAPGAYLVEGMPEDYRAGISPVDAHGRRLWWPAILEGRMAAVARRIVGNMRGLVLPGLTVEVSDRLKHLLVVNAGTMVQVEDLRGMLSMMFCWDASRITAAIGAARGD